MSTYFEGEDDLLIGARQGAPLAIGYGEGEMYLGSDALALAPFTDRIAYLEEGDCVALTRERGGHREAVRQRSPATGSAAKPGRQPAGGKGQLPALHGQGDYEQPEVVGHTLARYVDMAALQAQAFRLARRSKSSSSA